MNVPSQSSQQNISGVLEKVLVGGDLGVLSPNERLVYVRNVCESLGLNPLTKPFDYINLQGKLTLYCTRSGTDQLRDVRKVSLKIVGRERVGEIYVVTAQATMPDGRTDESTGAVAVGHLKGDQLCNALLKCESKAKRRVTLSICGLGWLEESELDTVKTSPISAIQSEPQIAASPVKPLSKDGIESPVTSVKQLSQAQLKRLFAISKTNAWKDGEVLELLEKKYGVKSTKELTKEQYDELCDKLLTQSASSVLSSLDLMEAPKVIVQPKEVEAEDDQEDLFIPEELR